jgi:hypothetical protein
VIGSVRAPTRSTNFVLGEELPSVSADQTGFRPCPRVIRADIRRPVPSFLPRWDNKPHDLETSEELLQRFVVSDAEYGEFASRTLGKIVRSFARIAKSEVNWRAAVHDLKHIAHQQGQLRQVVSEGSKHGVVTDVLKFRPHHMPGFLPEL